MCIRDSLVSAAWQADTLAVFVKVIFLFGFRCPRAALVKGAHGKHNMTMGVAAVGVVDNKIHTHSSGNKLRRTVFPDKPDLFLSGSVSYTHLLFYTALIGYIWYEAPAEEMNFTTLLEMINASEAREDDPEFQSPVDLMFERLAQKDPDHFAVRQYKKFLLSAGKTAKSILISCGARLAPFDIPQLREIISYDELELDKLGDEKSALFFLISDTDTTYNLSLIHIYKIA